jgi:hypothetical protein
MIKVWNLKIDINNKWKGIILCKHKNKDYNYKEGYHMLINQLILLKNIHIWKHRINLVNQRQNSKANNKSKR